MIGNASSFQNAWLCTGRCETVDLLLYHWKNYETQAVKIYIEYICLFQTRFL